MKRSRPVWLLIGQLFPLLLTGAPALATVHAQPLQQRLVLAFYYAWYDEKTWSAGQVPDMPLASYRSADRATIERHVQEARGAGIDALVQSWYGPGDNPTEANFRTLLDVAQAQGLRATVDFETTSPYMPDLRSAVDGLSHLIGVHAQHAAFLSYEGKPVIFFWNQRRYSLETWAAVRAQVDPERNTLWVADGDNPAWLDVFDGLHMYTITWPVNTNPEYTASKMRARVDRYNADHGTHRLWVATAMPGYDDTHVAGRAHPYVYPRSPDYYRRTWEAAMASAPEMVVITSYNEWREGTMIEPSVTYGRTYLDLTAELAVQFKRGASAAPTAMPVEALPTANPTPTGTPTPTSTVTATRRPTSTHTATPTATATRTPSPTWTPVPSATPTVAATHATTPTAVLSVTPTQTLAPPTATRTFAVPVTYSLDGTITPASTPASSSGPGPSSGPPCLAAGLLIGAATTFRVTSRRKSDC